MLSIFTPGFPQDPLSKNPQSAASNLAADRIQ
jgi:hypothetical protein